MTEESDQRLLGTPEQLLQAAVTHHQSGRLDQAQPLYEKVLDHLPHQVDALHYLGLLKHHRGLNQQALSLLQQAQQFAPDNPTILFNLGVIQQAMNRPEQAIEAYGKALEQKPTHPMTYNNIGSALEQLARFDEADQHYQKALALDPNCVEALNNRGNILKGKGQLTEAIEYYQRAITLRPAFADAYNNCAIAKQWQGRIDEAHRLLLKALEIDVNDNKARSNFLLNLNYSESLSQQEIFQLHQRYGDLSHGAPQHIASPARQDKKLRIAYLSPDFRTHSVAYFIRTILSHHDHDKFELFAYSNTIAEDTVSHELQQLCQHWKNISRLTDKEVVKLIGEDNIDILIDLAGHTANNRLAVFAMKPAPVQLSYLGYPNTTGNPAIDYRIVDHWTDPEPASDAYCSEKLIRLSRCFISYQPPKDAPEVNQPANAHNSFITFGSFNNLAKISTSTLDAWAAILSAVSESRLLLKSKFFIDPSTRKNVLEEFSHRGITAERITLLQKTPHTRGHLQQYHKMDIALDTFPYNGTTTTCEALWMGVPVISWKGERHAGRVGVSLLNACGLGYLVAESKEDYIHKAVELAQDRSGLNRLRHSLREQLENSALMDGQGLTRSLEQQYQHIWKRYSETRES